MLSGAGQYQGIGGTFGGAPRFLRRVADVSLFQAFDCLSLHLAGVGEQLVDLVLD